MKVFIGTSSSDAVDLKYKEMASSVSTMLARLDYKLVFGGSERGMMGKCYMTFKYEGKKVKAITELTYVDELKYLECDATEVKRTTFERTLSLFENADAILILPGGLGTIAELFGFIEEIRTKKIKKTLVLYNYENYYLGLLSVLRELHEKKFITSEDIKLITIINDEKSLEKYFKELRKKEN